ncbi:hypothetical protein LCGC14_2347260, partial [marine sediment metagenome]
MPSEPRLSVSSNVAPLTVSSPGKISTSSMRLKKRLMAGLRGARSVSGGRRLGLGLRGRGYDMRKITIELAEVSAEIFLMAVKNLKERIKKEKWALDGCNESGA